MPPPPPQRGRGAGAAGRIPVSLGRRTDQLLLHRSPCNMWPCSSRSRGPTSRWRPPACRRTRCTPRASGSACRAAPPSSRWGCVCRPPPSAPSSSGWCSTSAAGRLCCRGWSCSWARSSPWGRRRPPAPMRSWSAGTRATAVWSPAWSAHRSRWPSWPSTRGRTWLWSSSAVARSRNRCPAPTTAGGCTSSSTRKRLLSSSWWPSAWGQRAGGGAGGGAGRRTGRRSAHPRPPPPG